MRVGIPRTMATVQFHLRRAGTNVWVVQVSSSMTLHRVPSFSRVLCDLHPVVLAIFDLTRILQRLSEELAEVIVIGGIFETKVSNVRQVLGKFFGEAFAKVFDCGSLLLLTNLLVLLLVSGSLEALPREAATQEIHEDVAKSLEIISSRLLTSQMSVNTHVSSGS